MRRAVPPNWTPGKGVVTQKAPDAFDYARTAWQGVRKIWRLVNTESHHHDVAVAGQAITSTPFSQNLAIIAQGDNENSRSGISIKPISITCRGHFFINSSATNTSVRIIIYRGKQEAGTNATAPTVWGSGVTGVNALKVYDKRFKTKILWDRVYVLSNNSRGVAQFNVNLKLAGHITYDSATTSGTVYEDGGLYMAVVSTETTNTPLMSFNSRLRFTDN